MTNKLDEKDFIHEEYGKDPTPFWIWSFIILLTSILIWFLMLWYDHVMTEEKEQNPFLQVSNRDFSLFLWQNPQYMRVHSTNKIGYLPGFRYGDKIGLDPEKAENIVEAPPEILFLYHVWHRLLGNVFFERAIFWDRFSAFLNDAEEWNPKNWPKAPNGYIALIETGGHTGDLQKLPLDIFPLEVRQAYVGWLNYFKEGEQINAMQPSYQEIEKFLVNYPQYKRSLWCHIVDNYLQTAARAEDNVPSNEIAPFLRAALFNMNQRNP